MILNLRMLHSKLSQKCQLNVLQLSSRLWCRKPGQQRWNDASSSTLELHSVKTSDSSKYTCQVSNDAGKVDCTLVLFVKGACLQYCVQLHENFLIFLSDINISSDTNISYDRKDLMSSGSTRISFSDGTACLEVSSASKQDAGDYLCKATNDTGSEFCKARVTVKVKNLQVVDTADGEVSLAWEEPESDGGSKVIGYVVERRDVKRKTWTLATDHAESPECTVTGLQRDSMYLFRVSARNRVGNGPMVGTDKPVQAKNKFGKSNFLLMLLHFYLVSVLL
uniref:Fibronectin type-III domain-containing protein n=1 Tax=Mola mola TaxID=94237 RepID=A0A3Q3XGF5_MOLML